ncbi:MAG: UDP-N-acetylglucosamine--N-acetylmuramyl-(pentapeptide) pyrophosphoryl-undecaprenol N-acetylglucosamine transferase [Patescibacteria group bacterium]
MKKSNIVLTGGHAGTTALAFIQEFKKKYPKLALFWLGAQRAVEGKNVDTLESKFLPKEGVVFYPVFTGRIQRRFTPYAIPSFLKIPVGILHAFYLLVKIKPKLVVSFGGFAAFPVVLVGAILGIPVILHEQTAAAGRANRLSAFFARKIALARESSLKYFPKDKCVVVGNPILAPIVRVKAKSELGNPPTILISGGSRGSLTINNLINEILEKLLARYRVIHLTGELDFEKFRQREEKLPQKLKPNYKVFANIDPDQMAETYAKADIVIARAGANTVSEVLVVKRPALLIPLPFSYLDEQTKNATFAAESGIAKVLPQQALNSEKLLAETAGLIENWAEMVKGVQGVASPDLGAAKKLVNLCREYLT